VTDLIERLTSAAVEAIVAERPSLEHAPERLCRVVLELRLDGTGTA